MTCAEARRAILEADPSDLKGDGMGPLATHIRECSKCRELAGTVLMGETALGRRLAAAVPPPDLDRLLDEALGAASNSARPSTVPGNSRRTLPPRWRRGAVSLLPLAAAATLAALFLGRSPKLPGDPFHPSPETPGLGLEVPDGRSVAVLATNNPEITVLWFF